MISFNLDLTAIANTIISVGGSIAIVWIIVHYVMKLITRFLPNFINDIVRAFRDNHAITNAQKGMEKVKT